MKKKYGNQKKKAISLLAAVAVCLAVGLFVFLNHMGKQEEAGVPVTEEITGNTEPEASEESQPDIAGQESEAESESELAEGTEPEEPESMEPEEDTKAEETLEAAGQDDISGEFADTEQSGTMPEKPEVADQDAVENPEQPPQYEEEVTNPPTPQPPTGGDTNGEGKVYVPGFGYVDPPGNVVQEEAGSDGDWDKQIGDMN